SMVPITPLRLVPIQRYRHKMDYVSANNGDWFGYIALDIKDSKDARISCLQEFFSDIVASICDITIPINLEKYSIKNGIVLFRL
ncbi:MAG: hypothetical protein ACI3YP_09540, partial [Prevotella sp.]